jgi:hypothetical protein
MDGMMHVTHVKKNIQHAGRYDFVGHIKLYLRDETGLKQIDSGTGFDGLYGDGEGHSRFHNHMEFLHQLPKHIKTESQYKDFYCTFPLYSGLLHAIFCNTNTLAGRLNKTT